MPTNEDVLPHIRGQALLLGTGNEVVDQHTRSAMGGRPEIGEYGVEVVEAVEPHDHHPLGAQIRSPDAFEKSGVVHALDEDRNCL